MTTQVHDIGEEFAIKVLAGEVSLPPDVEVLLFHDGTDSLTADSDIEDINTEPDGASFERQVVDLDGDATWTLDQDAESDYFMEVTDPVSFDLSDSDNPSDIDAMAIVVEFEADGDADAQDHLWWTADLDQSYDVSSVDTLNVSEIGKTASGQLE